MYPQSLLNAGLSKESIEREFTFVEARDHYKLGRTEGCQVVIWKAMMEGPVAVARLLMDEDFRDRMSLVQDTRVNKLMTRYNTWRCRKTLRGIGFKASGLFSALFRIWDFRILRSLVRLQVLSVSSTSGFLGGSELAWEAAAVPGW